MVINTGVLTWDDARPLVHHFFNFWPDGEDRLWCKQLWPYIEKAGLTVFHTEKEEMYCREIPGLLALFYQEMTKRLGIDLETELTDSQLKEILCNRLDDIDETLCVIRNAILGNLREEHFFEITIESVFKGNNPPVTKHALSAEMRESATFPLRNIVIERMNDFIIAGSLHPNDFECFANFPDSYLPKRLRNNDV